MSSVAHEGRLAGKVALITGGAGNIGEVITQRYLAEGATVIITGRNEEKLQAYRIRLVDELGVAGERVVAMRMDGSDMQAVRSGITALVQSLGRIDILVNNAGSAGSRQRLPDIPLGRDDLRGDTETLGDSVGNLLGISWNMIRAVAPYMQAGSSIINISTIFSRTDYYGRIPYVVPKAALNALTLAVARELGAKGVRVNLVYPGPIDSERIRSVFKRMDELKGLPENTTAEGFFNIMRLSRPDATGDLNKGFPKTLDVANAVVFLGSDEAAALSGQAIEVTHGMDVPAESATTVISRPGLRAVDATGSLTLICAGDQLEDATALAGVLRSCGGEAVLAFRSRETLAELRRMFEEGRRLAVPQREPPLALYLNPLEPASVEAAFATLLDYSDALDAAIILPARSFYPASLVSTDDTTVAQFLEQELVGTIALSSQLARFWQERSAPELATAKQPRVLFMSNADDGQGNAFADLIRAGTEQLVRVWRHEASLDAAKQRHETQPPSLPPVWANQLVRFSNCESENLDFACSWAAKILHSDRQVDEINLYLPKQISRTTGAQRPSFGWAESLIGLHLGKTALITGGSAGIGGEVGRLLALSGARVMLAARGADQLNETRREIMQQLEEVGYNDAASRIQVFPDCDVSNEAQLAALVEHTIAAFGKIDYLLNNAGISGVEEMVIDLPLEGWRHTLQANLNSNYSLVRKVAPLMKRAGSGYILNVSSYFGGEKYVAIPYPNRADYAVSKAGQRAMAEVLARFLGPEVQINALAPGPVEGDRLRGTGERPGLFARRGRLILENKRLNEVHTALIQAYRSSGQPMEALLAALQPNSVQQLADGGTADLPAELRQFAEVVLKESDPAASSRSFLCNRSIAQKLLRRLQAGGYIASSATFEPAHLPPDPFFTRNQIDREARKVRDGIMTMLYLQRMPTEFDVAIATVYYLADRAVSGETFHPSGGLRFERTATGGELFGIATPERLAKLAGSTVFIIGEHLQEHLVQLSKAYLDRYQARQVVLITETEAGATSFREQLAPYVEVGKAHTLVAGDHIEAALDEASAQYGRPGPVVCSPFRALPTNPLVGRSDSDWSTVLNEAEFVQLVEQQITHHFRVAHKLTLMDNIQLVFVTTETTATSTTEQFALANFVKTTLHAFTATIGVESERHVHRPLVNQVDLTRRARAEEPRSPAEAQQEIARFIDAIMLTTAPLPSEEDSRYAGRIFRGRAITV
jgi:malonyl-CoA reductase / 3-hydroxypropionate dehydrogenase (NADP+)